MKVQKLSISHEGKSYYSVRAVAKLLGTTTTKVRALMVREGFEWLNFRINGRLWISAESVDAYIRHVKKKP